MRHACYSVQTGFVTNIYRIQLRVDDTGIAFICVGLQNNSIVFGDDHTVLKRAVTGTVSAF